MSLAGVKYGKYAHLVPDIVTIDIGDLGCL
jgi:hypothetical protein